MRGARATARALEEHLEGVVRRTSSERFVSMSGTSVVVDEWVEPPGADESDLGGCLYVQVRLAERRLDGRRIKDCLITVRVEGLCTLLIPASCDDVHTAVITASARALRAVVNHIGSAT